MRTITLAILSAAIALGGCATASKDVPTTYASPIQFNNYTCDQITAESARLQVRLAQLEGRLDTAANNDKVLTGVAIVLFWPAAFALGGTKEQEAEYGRLKGEHDALRQAWIQKSCNISAAVLLPGAVLQLQGTSTTPASVSFAVGDKLTYRARESVSGANQGEFKIVISSIANGEIGFDDDSLVMNGNGSVVRGDVVRNTILGVDLSRLHSGAKLQGKFRITAARVQDVPVDLNVVGSEIVEISGQRITAIRLDATGYSTREVTAGAIGFGAQFSGTLLVDSVTGTVISMKIKSKNPMYGTDFALIAIARASLPQERILAPSTATTMQVAPQQVSTVPASKSREERLRELKGLYDAGLISADLYSAQQKRILGD